MGEQEKCVKQYEQNWPEPPVVVSEFRKDHPNPANVSSTTWTLVRWPQGLALEQHDHARLPDGTAYAWRRETALPEDVIRWLLDELRAETAGYVPDDVSALVAAARETSRLLKVGVHKIRTPELDAALAKFPEALK